MEYVPKGHGWTWGQVILTRTPVKKKDVPGLSTFGTCSTSAST